MSCQGGSYISRDNADNFAHYLLSESSFFIEGPREATPVNFNGYLFISTDGFSHYDIVIASTEKERLKIRRHLFSLLKTLPSLPSSTQEWLEAYQILEILANLNLKAAVGLFTGTRMRDGFAVSIIAHSELLSQSQAIGLLRASATFTS